MYHVRNFISSMLVKYRYDKNVAKNNNGYNYFYTIIVQFPMNIGMFNVFIPTHKEKEQINSNKSNIALMLCKELIKSAKVARAIILHLTCQTF